MPDRAWTTAAAVLLSLAAAPGRAEPDRSCADRSVTVDARRGDGEVTLLARSDGPIEATLTLTARLQNMESSVPLPLTADVIRGSPRSLATFRPEDRGRGWHYEYRYDWVFGLRGGHPDHEPYALPWPRGASYRVLQGPGGAFSHHPGTSDAEAVDFDLPLGAEVAAAREGLVVAARGDSTEGGPDDSWGTCANYVVVRHADGTYGRYLHFRPGGVVVRVGQRVGAGDRLGYAGRTGFADRPHLHFVVSRITAAGKSESVPVVFATNVGPRTVPREGDRLSHPRE